MNSIELGGIDWLAQGWLLILAFTAAALLAAALRRPCRRLFGAERAFQLWLLPPLALLASQLPHAAEAPVTVLPSVVFAITSAASALPAHAAAPNALDWRAGVALFWLAGTLASLGLAVIAQSRYRVRLRGASAVHEWRLPWPVLRAGDPGVGPALVGAWRSRIVLPADFEQRYDATEQTLILAHEVAHARRGDGWWCLLARILAALCWFHPLAWWALAALRHDQELACDAAVLREHGARRRSYANAMLKTQSAAFALPVGCTWSPRHPLTERIAMLNSKPRFSGRHIGAIAVSAIAGVVAAAVYAAVPASSASAPVSDRYTLKVDIGFDGQPAEAHFTQCLKPGEFSSFNGSRDGVPDWHGRFAVVPAAQGEIEVRTRLEASFTKADGSVQTLSVQPVVRTASRKQATILLGAQVALSPDGAKVSAGEPAMRVDLTPSAGCAGGLAPAA